MKIPFSTLPCTVERTLSLPRRDPSRRVFDPALHHRLERGRWFASSAFYPPGIARDPVIRWQTTTKNDGLPHRNQLNQYPSFNYFPA